jgi:hypothetical protein
MNGVKEEYHVKMEQTSKGIWYCSGLDVASESSSDIGLKADQIMTTVEGVLTKHNAAISQSAAPGTLDVGFVPLKGQKVAK